MLWNLVKPSQIFAFNLERGGRGGQRIEKNGRNSLFCHKLKSEVVSNFLKNMVYFPWSLALILHGNVYAE